MVGLLIAVSAYFDSAFFVIAFITKRNPIVRAAPIGSVIHAF